MNSTPKLNSKFWSIYASISLPFFALALITNSAGRLRSNAMILGALFAGLYLAQKSKYFYSYIAKNIDPENNQQKPALRNGQTAILTIVIGLMAGLIVPITVLFLKVKFSSQISPGIAFESLFEIFNALGSTILYQLFLLGLFRFLFERIGLNKSAKFTALLVTCALSTAIPHVVSFNTLNLQTQVVVLLRTCCIEALYCWLYLKAGFECTVGARIISYFVRILA